MQIAVNYDVYFYHLFVLLILANIYFCKAVQIRRFACVPKSPYMNEH